ncbi:MAG: ankyrin repeat domain-containing protein [Deltaproteobacteria bacterium]|nr:ankyrin repeat domain-containing protein [Deltaproteobacteria bacterium]
MSSLSVQEINSKLCQAIEKVDVATFKELLKEVTDVNSLPGDGKHPLLSYAVFFDNAEIIESLINKGANVNTWYKGVSGEEKVGTALSLASSRGFLEAVKMFVENGADIEAAGINGNTALLLAMDRILYPQIPPVVEYLVNHGANVNAVNDDGDTPVIKAINKGAIDMYDFLKSKGASDPQVEFGGLLVKFLRDDIKRAALCVAILYKKWLAHLEAKKRQGRTDYDGEITFRTFLEGKMGLQYDHGDGEGGMIYKTNKDIEIYITLENSYHGKEIDNITVNGNINIVSKGKLMNLAEQIH